MAIRNVNLGGTTDWQDTGTTTLNGAIDNAVTTITVVATASFKSAGNIYIDSELISYTGITATTFTGCTRGIGINGAASHTDTTTVDEKEILTSTDQNDTMDAAFNKIQTLSTFWLNSDLYDVYDNFDSYGTGAITSNANWTFSGTTTINNTQKAGGTQDELVIQSIDTSNVTTLSIATSLLLVANRHTFIRVKGETGNASSSTNVCGVAFGNTGTYYTIASGSAVNAQTCIHVINTAIGSYDLYLGGLRVAQYSSIADVDAQISLRTSANDNGSVDTSRSTLYIDDVRQSGFDVN